MEQKLRVWLDDERKMPSSFDVHCRKAEEVIELIKQNKVLYASLDNDLGDYYSEGKTVAQFIEKAYISGEIEFVNFIPHTSNPVAFEEMMACKRAIQKFRMKQNEINKVPTTEDDWVDYSQKGTNKSLVHLIKLDDKGNDFRFQYNGMLCNQYYGKGVLIGSFYSDHKYFNARNWNYTLNWFNGEDIVCFLTDEQRKKQEKTIELLYSGKIQENDYDSWCEEFKNECRGTSVKKSDILTIIFSIVKEELKDKISFENIQFKDWEEACIPFTMNDEDYLITWMNCD